jgi:phosphoglycolate phosphatase
MTAGRARPSLLLYDWDNTLVDAWAGVTAALNATFAAFGLPAWTAADTRANVRGSLRDSFPAMFGADWTRARDIFYATLTEAHLDHLHPMPGAEAALQAGSAWPLGVVSNKAGDFLRAEVAHLGWARHFSAVVGAGDAASDKPDAAPILLALRLCGAVADDTIWYLGDTALDMQAARAAGVTAVLVGDAAHDGGIARAAPDLQFHDALALAHHLRALA